MYEGERERGDGERCMKDNEKEKGKREEMAAQ